MYSYIGANIDKNLRLLAQIAPIKSVYRIFLHRFVLNNKYGPLLSQLIVILYHICTTNPAVIRKGGKIFATQRGYGEFKDWWELTSEALLDEIESTYS